MSQITKIEMWKDTGFQEGSVEVPSVNDILPELTSSTDNYIKIAYDGGIRTSTADFFSGFTIPEVFADYLSYSYLRVTYEYNNSDDPMIFYGWIDDIALKSDTADQPAIYVSWHIDYWRTYLGSAKLGYGMIQSRPAGTNDPPQSLSYRWRLPGEFSPLIPTATGTDINWLIFTYVKESNDSKVTDIRTCVVPIDKNNLDTNHTLKIGDKTVSTPSLSDLTTGRFITNMKISASQVTSAFISPIPPLAIESVSGTTYTLATYQTSDPEYERSPFDDTKVKRVESMRITGNGPESIIINYSDGTSSTRTSTSNAQTKAWLDNENGVMSGGPLTVRGGPAYFGKVNEIMETVFPNQPFKNGDSVTFNDVALSRTTNYQGYGVPVKFYTVTLEEKQNRTYTYNNGWPTTTIYADHRFEGIFTYEKSSAQFAVDVETAQNDASRGYAFTKSQDYYEYDIDNLDILTTDKREYVITDMNGQAVGAFPWGLHITHGKCRVVASSVSAYIQYRFADDPTDSATSGLEFSIPLMPVDIASNSWVDYVYSGQRDYDISQRKIAANQSLVGSITSSLTGATSNAVMGSIGGVDQSHWENWVASFVSGGANGASLADIRGALTSMYAKSPNAVRAIGALDQAYSNALYSATPPAVSFGGGKAFGASMAVGLASAAIEYATTQYFNGKLQKAEDMLQAKQFDNITIPGGGWDWLWHGREIGVITLVADKYSLDRFEADKRLNGIYCSEPTEDCDYVRTSEGPYRISELIVSGSIPVQARAHIKGRFANGVRIRTINTETVTEGD